MSIIPDKEILEGIYELIRSKNHLLLFIPNYKVEDIKKHL